MQFIDRKAKYPGRWTMKKSDGTSEVVTLIRNDEPTVEGTPLNAKNLNEATSVDPTLTLSGKAADAKATGAAVDKLEDKKADKTDLETERKRIDVLNDGGLNLKDEVIDASIKTWLTDHPEATTTVQDGAITETKINADFLLSIKNGYVTPEMFGAVGDGIADDTESFKKAVDFCKNNSIKCIRLLPKTYKITDTIDFTDCESITLMGDKAHFQSVRSRIDVKTPTGFLVNNKVNVYNIYFFCYYCKDNSDTNFDSICFSGRFRGSEISNNKFHGFKIALKAGFSAVTHCHNNVFYSTRRYGIRCDEISQDGYIYNNYFTGNRVGERTENCAIYIKQCGLEQIYHNWFEFYRTCIWLSAGSYVYITENLIDYCYEFLFIGDNSGDSIRNEGYLKYSLVSGNRMSRCNNTYATSMFNNLEPFTQNDYRCITFCGLNGFAKTSFLNNGGDVDCGVILSLSGAPSGTIYKDLRTEGTISSTKSNRIITHYVNNHPQNITAISNYLGELYNMDINDIPEIVPIGASIIKNNKKYYYDGKMFRDENGIVLDSKEIFYGFSDAKIGNAKLSEDKQTVSNFGALHDMFCMDVSQIKIVYYVTGKMTNCRASYRLDDNDLIFYMQSESIIEIDVSNATKLQMGYSQTSGMASVTGGAIYAKVESAPEYMTLFDENSIRYIQYLKDGKIITHKYLL